MTKKILDVKLSLSALLIAALGASLVFVSPASAARWHKHSERVTEEVSTWATNYEFAPSQSVQSAVYVDGHELRENATGCRSTSIGHGVVAILSTCETGKSHMRMRAASLDGHPHRVTVVYRPISGPHPPSVK